MTDLSQFREPVEVYEAALGNRQPLVERLRSEESLGKLEREALACLIDKKLKPPRRRRGNPGADKGKPKYLNTMVEYLLAMLKPHADNRARLLKQQRKADGRREKADQVAENVAKELLVPPGAEEAEERKIIDDFLDYTRRSKMYKEGLKPQSPSNAVERFHHWLYVQGRTEWMRLRKKD